METTTTAHYESSDPSPTAPARPRVWPAILIIALFWTARQLLANIDMPIFQRFMGTLAATAVLMLAFLLWWTIDRRGRRGQRLVPVLAWLVGGILAGVLSFKSLGPMPLILTAMPWVFTAWTLWIVVARAASMKNPRFALAAVIVAVWGAFTLVRMEGLTGEGGTSLAWRWAPTAEDRYLAQQRQHGAATTAPAMAATIPTDAGPQDWPEFRGKQRDGIVRGLSIKTDWNAAPPKQLWKIPVGPGWSSMTIVGDRLFTQEQRGDTEAVVCRQASTGNELWAHLEPVRFTEGMAGPGPRATPTFAGGKLYTLGATGLLTCLDPATGDKKWQRDIATQAGAKLPIWGFSASPLITHNLVIVYGEEKGVLAYDLQTGDPAWATPQGKMSYSSPQLALIGGEEQVLMWSDRGIVAMNATDGKIRWEREVGPASGMPRSLQPHATADCEVVVASEGAAGAAMIDLKKEGANWQSNQRWSTTRFRPSFNDFVVKGDYLYGIDGGALCCVNLKDGQRTWRKGRYGSGQLLLLDDQALLVVACETGEVALVAAKPDAHQELARFQAIEGKTWNHPAIANGCLFVRNGQEMACFNLK
jgi:outer membrane protein assembly factor BamB